MDLKNARTLGLRIDASHNEILARWEADTHMEGVGLARAALYAALQYYNTHGSISLPLQVTPVAKTAVIEKFPVTPKALQVAEDLGASDPDSDSTQSTESYSSVIKNKRRKT